MIQDKYPKQNSLVLYRRRMGFSQKQVAMLLGHRNITMLSRYEHGHSLPPLQTALRLEIAYRAPVAFLFHEWYRQLRQEMRTQEERLRLPTQAALF